MSVIVIRDVQTSDLDQILVLNANEEQWTSPMDDVHLKNLVSLAAYKRALTVDARVSGFLIAMANNCGYQNDNFNWFRSRYKKFFYIDRIVIDRKHGGGGLGGIFYDDVIAFAKDNSYERIVCEYSIQPMNEVSRAFHAKMGFVEVGKRYAETSEKAVSMQSKTL